MNISATSKRKAGKVKRDNRATKMIIVISFIYFFGNSIDASLTFLQLFGVDIYNGLPIVLIVDNIFLFGSHSITIFPYYIYNRNFKAFFKNTFLPGKYHVTVSQYSTRMSNSVASNYGANKLE